MFNYAGWLEANHADRDSVLDMYRQAESLTKGKDYDVLYAIGTSVIMKTCCMVVKT